MKGSNKIERYRFCTIQIITPCLYGDTQNRSTFPAGTYSCGITFDGTNIRVANNGSNSVMKLRASDGIVFATYAVGFNPMGVAFDGTNIWVANYDSNSVRKHSLR